MVRPDGLDALAGELTRAGEGLRIMGRLLLSALDLLDWDVSRRAEIEAQGKAVLRQADLLSARAGEMSGRLSRAARLFDGADALGAAGLASAVRDNPVE